jgi:hypothetical protein
MNRYLIVVIAFGAGMSQAQQLDLKTGAWEVTTSGGPLPRPLVTKECVTQADLAQFSSGPDKDEDAECKYDRPPAISGKTWSADKSCPGGRKMRAEFTAETAERIRGSITILPGKSQPATAIQINGRWLTGSCKGPS